MSYMDRILILHAIAVIVTSLSFIALLYCLVAFAGLLERGEDDA